MSIFATMTDLARSHAELRAAVILAGKEIRKLNFGRAGNPTLVETVDVFFDNNPVFRLATDAKSKGQN
jgi:hypothetical protein